MPGQTLQATALVHEAYLRLVGSDRDQHWDSPGHFFAAAAEAMRRILIDNACRKQAERHGGGWQRQELLDEYLFVAGAAQFYRRWVEEFLRVHRDRASRWIHPQLQRKVAGTRGDRAVRAVTAEGPCGRGRTRLSILRTVSEGSASRRRHAWHPSQSGKARFSPAGRISKRGADEPAIECSP